MLIAAALFLEASASSLIGPPEPGVRRYSYESTQTVNGAPNGGYRTQFRLETGADGAIDAVIETTGVTQATGTWTATQVTEACRKRLHAPVDGVARVRLWPLSEEAKGLGPAFLDTCAPATVFFPLTDILNVVLVPNAPRFGASRLTKVGQAIEYPAFTTTFERLDQHFTEAAKGGVLRYVSIKDGVAVLEWAPKPAELQIMRGGMQPVTLIGTEHWAFRLELLAPGAALVSAKTTMDDLDLKAHPVGTPETQIFPVHIHRDVLITPR